MGIYYCRIVLYFSLLLLLLSMLALATMDTSAPGFVPAALSLALNALTASGAGICIHRLSRRKRG